MIDAETAYRALSARDARFDGAFFVGVKTTGIYCRPVCPARRPRRESCRFFPVAAAAEEEGFRPCLRCRPELAPGAAPIDGARGLVAAAVARIESGALSEGSVGDLARSLGVGERQLRRRFEAELGVGPQSLALTHRLLLAKRLLTDSGLPVVRVAFAAGFGSLRRFNEAFRERYGMTPRELRGGSASRREEVVIARLGHRPPLAWERLLVFLAPRAIPGVEEVRGGAWTRWVAVGAAVGRIEVRASSRRAELELRLPPALVPGMLDLMQRTRRLFDLDADPVSIDAHLLEDARLEPLVRRHPGLRTPGAWDGFEVAWRAVLGQQVSVKGATTLAGRLVEKFGRAVCDEAGESGRLSPEPEDLADTADSELTALGITRSRAAAIIALARAVIDGAIGLEQTADAAEAHARILALRGFGPWTASYLGMRVSRDPDAFPAGDLALRRALDDASEAQARRIAEAWRPWRSYAAMHLWNDLMERSAR